MNYGIHMATYSKFVLFMGECEGRKKSVAKKGLCYYENEPFMLQLATLLRAIAVLIC